MVSNILVDRSHQIWRIAIFNVEAEFSLEVRLRVTNFLHAGGKLDQNNLVARGRLACRAVCHRAAEGGCGRECRQHAYNESCKAEVAETKTRDAQVYPFWYAAPGDSRRSISARIAAASSSSDCFMVA